MIARLDLKKVILAGWSFGCLDAYAYVRREGIGNVKASVAIDELPKSLAAAKNDGGEGDVATWRQFIDGTTYARRDFTREFSKWMVKCDPSAKQLDWLVDQSLQTPTSTALLLLDAMFADYTAEARLMDGKIPVLNVLREERAERALAWIRTNLRELRLQRAPALLGGAGGLQCRARHFPAQDRVIAFRAGARPGSLDLAPFRTSIVIREDDPARKPRPCREPVPK